MRDDLFMPLEAEQTIKRLTVGWQEQAVDNVREIAVEMYTDGIPWDGVLDWTARLVATTTGAVTLMQAGLVAAEAGAPVGGVKSNPFDYHPEDEAPEACPERQKGSRHCSCWKQNEPCCLCGGTKTGA